MRDDPEDPERDVTSRLEEMKSRELIQLLLNNYKFALFVIFTNLILLLRASKGYWNFVHMVVPFIFVYFLGVIDCRWVQVGVFTFTRYVVCRLHWNMRVISISLNSIFLTKFDYNSNVWPILTLWISHRLHHSFMHSDLCIMLFNHDNFRGGGIW